MMKQETETLRTAAEILSSSRVVASIIDSGGPYGDGLKDLNTLITALDLWCEEYGLSWSKDLSGTVSIQTANGAIIGESEAMEDLMMTICNALQSTKNNEGMKLFCWLGLHWWRVEFCCNHGRHEFRCKWCRRWQT